MIDQLFIGVFGVASILLANDPRATARRWAPIFGLCAQPFWFWSSYHAEQWGIFALAFVYAGGWARGFYHHWIKQGRAA